VGSPPPPPQKRYTEKGHHFQTADAVAMKLLKYFGGFFNANIFFVLKN
jgi:hypothetical protein